jgi:hypothetical protein
LTFVSLATVRVLEFKEIVPMSSQLTTIADFLTPEDAEVARLALQDEGILSFLENATTVGMVWYWGNAVGWVKLQVPEADAERARAVLAQKGVGADNRTCSSCGASLPPNFDVCWSCQTPVDVESENTVPQPIAGLSEKQPEEDRPEDTATGDAMAWRACIGAMVGIFTCFLLNFYSAWLILRLGCGNYPLSQVGSRNFYWAILINLAVGCALGLITGY